ncbi:MAG: citrate transporter [Lewinellaceae bacterium]|nr:citrate transporter [Lewinellaceae bacterium]
MLFITGILIVLVLLALILSKATSALTALILVPVAGALIAGFGLDTAKFAVEGIKNIAPVAAMFIFAILFFGVLTDAGMFDPIINRTLRMVGHDPVRIAMGAAVLSMVVHLDGSGAVTFLITVPAMLPLFDRLGMDRRILAGVVALGAGAMNIVPWGGPTLRASSALEIPVTDLYNPIILPQLAGLAFVLFVAWRMGKREAARLGLDSGVQTAAFTPPEQTEAEKSLRRPKLFWVNIALTVLTIAVLISGKIAPALVFMLSAVLALMVNYPSLKDQKERIDAHAKAALMMAGILMAAGVFTGIMKESGMITAMAREAVAVIPAGMGAHIPVAVAVLSMPLSLVFDPDSFYFGFLPVIAEVGQQMNVSPASVGQAAILGQMTTGFPFSPLTATTFLLTGLTGIDLADHQRFSMKYAFLTTLVMTLVALLLGVFPV